MKLLATVSVLSLIFLSSLTPASATATKDPWDLLLSVNVDPQTGLTEYAGAEFDGTYFYLSLGASADLIQQFDRNGTLVRNITIPGVPFIQDLAYDGTYFYGGAVDHTIYIMNFTSETLVGTIPSPILVSGIAYNPDLDAFYVSWWSWEVDLVARDGTVLDTIAMDNPANARFGLAYDNVSPGGPFLWVFDQGLITQYQRARIYQWDLAARNFTGFYYDVGADMGSGWGIAKGLFLTSDYEQGTYCIGGMMADCGLPPSQRYVGDFLFVYELFSTNAPPQTPPAPDGPANGITGTTYNFTAMTEDPDGDTISYLFDWGDGTMSEWLGPYPSGAIVTGDHSWATTGSFDVRVKARDDLGAESNWSVAHPITIQDELTIASVAGGFLTVKAVVENQGPNNLTNISWSMSLNGLVFLGKKTTGTIPSLAPGGQEMITSKPVLGFGKSTITITAGTATEKADATILLLYIKIK